MGLDPQKSGNRWPCNCVLWMDILGTEAAICVDQSLVEEKVEHFRELVKEHVVPAFDELERLYVGFIGDGVVVAYPDLSCVLQAAGRLMKKCLDKAIKKFKCKQTIGKSETHKMTLLRGAVGRSPTGEVPDKGCQYDTIPIIGKAFGDAFKLEQIRKGSRIYVATGLKNQCPSLPIKHWKGITGERKCTCRNETADEYLWPAEAYWPEELAKCVTDTYALWLKIVRSEKNWREDSYKHCPLQFDETVKVCIRSCGFARNQDGRMNSAVRQSLVRLLSEDENDAKKYVQYRWGFWFLAMEALLLSKGCDKDLEGVVRNAWEVVQNARDKQATDAKNDFEKELHKPDYNCFKNRLERLGILTIPTG